VPGAIALSVSAWRDVASHKLAWGRNVWTCPPMPAVPVKEEKISRIQACAECWQTSSRRRRVRTCAYRCPRRPRAPSLRMYATYACTHVRCCMSSVIISCTCFCVAQESSFNLHLRFIRIVRRGYVIAAAAHLRGANGRQRCRADATPRAGKLHEPGRVEAARRRVLFCLKAQAADAQQRR